MYYSRAHVYFSKSHSLQSTVFFPFFLLFPSCCHRVVWLQRVAGLLLCGILSDTLNLCSPTTTEADKLIVVCLCFASLWLCPCSLFDFRRGVMQTLLASLAEVKDVNALAQSLFKAKSKQLAMCLSSLFSSLLFSSLLFSSLLFSSL